jgi:hypothetical protein
MVSSFLCRYARWALQLWVRRCCAAAEFSCEIGGLGLYLRGLVIFWPFFAVRVVGSDEFVVREKWWSCSWYLQSSEGRVVLLRPRSNSIPIG